MALRAGAAYIYGCLRTRLRALNDDLTRAEFDNVIGGAGPFDYSSLTATITAVPFSLKINDAAVVEDTIDLTAAVDKSAVTVAELVIAFNAASITGWTASAQAVTGRFKLVHSTSGAYVQVYGLGARLCMIGQGKGLKAIKSDTIQTFNNTPTMKEAVTQTITDSNNKDTEVIIEGYKKGWTGSMVDTAEDYEMFELVESGVLSADGLTYSDPISSTKKVMFEIETYTPKYSAGTNDEDQITGWEHKTFRAVKGSMGDHVKAAGFTTSTFNLTGVNYKTAAGVEQSAIVTVSVPFASWSTELFDSI